MADQGETIRLGKRCFVGNLAWKTSWQDLKDKFREAGNVVYTNVMRDDDGEPPLTACSPSAGPSAVSRIFYVFCEKHHPFGAHSRNTRLLAASVLRLTSGHAAAALCLLPV